MMAGFLLQRNLIRSSPSILARSHPYLPLKAQKAFYSDGPSRTSVVKNTPDGVEPVSKSSDGVTIPAGVTSGAPDELAVRPVRIYRPSPTTMQSAKATSHKWVVDWDTLQGGGSWENPLMGWASSADYMQGTQLSFGSSDEAVAFCEKQGVRPVVVLPRGDITLQTTLTHPGKVWDYEAGLRPLNLLSEPWV